MLNAVLDPGTGNRNGVNFEKHLRIIPIHVGISLELVGELRPRLIDQTDL